MNNVFKPIPMALLCLALISCKRDHLNGDGPEYQNAVLSRVNISSIQNVGGFYEALPARYYSNSEQKRYPVIFSFSGAGTYGTDSIKVDEVLRYGPQRVIAAKMFSPFYIEENNSYSFIVLAPQFIEQPNMEQVDAFVEYAKSIYRIDESRIYLAGSSVGGRTACDYAAAKPGKISAVVAMSGTSDTDVMDKCRTLTENLIPVWIFHNIEDDSWPPIVPRTFYNTIMSLNPKSLSKLTIINEKNHNAWVLGSDPVYKEDGKNIYEWMLGFHK